MHSYDNLSISSAPLSIRSCVDDRHPGVMLWCRWDTVVAPTHVLVEFVVFIFRFPKLEKKMLRTNRPHIHEFANSEWFSPAHENQILELWKEHLFFFAGGKGVICSRKMCLSGVVVGGIILCLRRISVSKEGGKIHSYSPVHVSW